MSNPVLPIPRVCRECEKPMVDCEPEVVTMGEKTFSFRPVVCDVCAARVEARRHMMERGKLAATNEGRSRQWGSVCKDPLFCEPFEMSMLGSDKARATASRVFEWRETSGKGIGLLGPTGVGKSRILYELMRRWYVDAGKSVCLLPLTELARVCAASATGRGGGEAWVKLIGRAIECDFLLLEDLGKEKPTQRVEADLGDILDARYRGKRPVFCSTNFTGAALEGRFDPVNGPPLIRRLRELCELLTIY